MTIETKGMLNETSTPGQYLDEEGNLYVVDERLSTGKPALVKVSSVESVKK